MNQNRMTDAQFEALATLLRLRTGPAREAVRLVLVHGKTVPQAAAQTEMRYENAWQAVERVRAGLALARRAIGQPEPQAAEKLIERSHQ